ncbi:MAG: DUF6261 family protein [Prevotellaceae bacterium]|jgi:hypothetical protein|nr:DUF6261 family protein [Prevotellaceae bacterium]
MKIEKLRTENLHNEEWFMFYTEFKTLVENCETATLNIDSLFATFLTLYANADAALEVIRKSAITEQIAEADNERDIVFRGLAEAVKSALYHFNVAKRQAAKRLQVVLDHYGNIARKSYDEETAAIINFLQELNGEYAADISLLGLNEWVTQIDGSNRAFDALQQARYAEGAAKTDIRMVDVRKETDRIYRSMIDRINASILLNGETQYAPFVKDLNIRVEHYGNIISQRKGRTDKKKNDKEKQE